MYSINLPCPKCKDPEAFEVLFNGERQENRSLDITKQMMHLLEQSMYGQCTKCGNIIEGMELVDFLEHHLLGEGE